MTVVLDASVVVALLVADRRQATVRDRMRRWIASGEDLHAPAVLPYEVANVLARRVHDGDLPIDEVAEIWADIADLGVEFHPFDLTVDGPAVARITTSLRRRHATDSAYVQLARRLATDVFTLDGPLARNAATVGLPVTLLE